MCEALLSSANGWSRQHRGGAGLTQVRRTSSEDCSLHMHGYAKRRGIAIEHQSVSLSGQAEGVPNATRAEKSARKRSL